MVYTKKMVMKAFFKNFFGIVFLATLVASFNMLYHVYVNIIMSKIYQLSTSQILFVIYSIHPMAG